MSARVGSLALCCAMALASLACAPAPALEGPLPRPGAHAIDASGEEVLPLLRIEPSYPANAMTERKEGFVIVEFSVTEDGSVADARVIRAKSGAVFNKAALDAVKRWKYPPLVVDGKPTKREGLRVRLDFRIRPL